MVFHTNLEEEKTSNYINPNFWMVMNNTPMCDNKNEHSANTQLFGHNSIDAW